MIIWIKINAEDKEWHVWADPFDEEGPIVTNCGLVNSTYWDDTVGVEEPAVRCQRCEDALP